MIQSRKASACLWLAAAVGFGAAGALPAYADDSGQQQTNFVRVADLFGESDEEKAARLAKEQAQDAAIAQDSQKINDLVDTVTRLTGQMEELHHQLDEANAHIERMQKDFDYRICTMAAQQLGTSPDQGGIPCGASGPSPSATLPPMTTVAPAPSAPVLTPPSSGAGGAATGAPQQLGTPPGILGQIPSDTAMPIPPPAAVSDSTAPGAGPPQYVAAMKLLSKAQYSEASAAFRSFADADPQDPMASQAVYWVGDIAFVQKDYAGAARTFVEEIKKYGTSSRAPDSMLKLGQSLIAMNQKPQGCMTLEALPGKYPQASPNILAQAKATRKNDGCK